MISLFLYASFKVIKSEPEFLFLSGCVLSDRDLYNLSIILTDSSTGFLIDSSTCSLIGSSTCSSIDSLTGYSIGSVFFIVSGNVL